MSTISVIFEDGGEATWANVPEHLIDTITAMIESVIGQPDTIRA